MLPNKINKGFTFVELIVVISVLAVLWIIWFYTLTSNLESARDSSNITAMNNIKSTLVSYKVNKWYYPKPTNSTDIMYSWSVVWSQWTFGKDVIEKVDWSEETIVDAYTKNEFTYSITSNKKEFQLAWVVENRNGDSISFNNLLIPGSFAATKNPATAVVIWDYNWNIITIDVLWISNILSIPSIIASDLSSNNLLDILNNNRLVHDWGTNLPASYASSIFKVNTWEKLAANNLIIFSWSLTNLKKEKNRLKLLLKMKKAYNWTLVEKLGRKYLRDINIDLVHPSKRSLNLACDMVKNEINYPINCKNESFFAIPVKNVNLSNIDFSWLISQNVNSVLLDTNLNTWFGTNNWLSKYSWGVWTSITTSNWLVGNNVNKVSQVANGDIWVSTNAWISIFNNTTSSWTSITTSNGLVSNKVKTINQIKTNGDIWVSTDDWISVFTWTTLKASYTDVLISKDINRVVEKTNGDIWVSTDDWISVFNWTSWHEYKDVLVGENVSTTIQVSNGDIWVATDEWISVFDWTNWTSYKDELIDKNVINIFQSNDNKIWVSTEKWVSVFDWTNWNEYSVSDWLISEEIKDIFQDTNNNMWFVSKKWLSKLVNGSFINYPNDGQGENSDNNHDWISNWVYVVSQSTWFTVIWIKNN